MVKDTTENATNVSYYLGVLSLCFALFVPIIAFTFSIIGLCVKKNPQHSDRDIMLNAFGLALSLVSWIVTTLWLLS